MPTLSTRRDRRVTRQMDLHRDISSLDTGRATLICLIAGTLVACGTNDWDESATQEWRASTSLAAEGGSTDVVRQQIAAPTAPAEGSVAPKTVTTKPVVADQAAATTKPTPSVSVTDPGGGDWLDTLVNDMKLFHDGPAYTLKYIPGWGTGRYLPETYSKPDGWTIAGAWGVITADHPVDFDAPWRVAGPYTGNQAANTRAQVRDLQLWWLKSNGQWVLGAHNAAPGGNAHLASWADDANIPGDIRDESSNGGGVSMRYVNQGSVYGEYLYHFYGSPSEVPSDYVGFATAFFARKILHDPNGPDDRARARLLADGAGDWWTAPGAKWDYFKTNWPMGYNRFKYLTNEWQLISFHSLTEAQIRANPPPIIGR